MTETLLDFATRVRQARDMGTVKSSAGWDDLIPALRALWDEGHSTAEIGRRLGVTKNAIVGKAHRLGLPDRPSPIKYERGPHWVPRVRRTQGATLPPLASAASLPLLANAPVLAVPRSPTAAPRLTRALGLPKPLSPFDNLASRPVPKVEVAPRPYARIVMCMWPIGEPGTKGFRFCDLPSVPGRSYCEACCKVGYVRVRDRREDV